MSQEEKEINKSKRIISITYPRAGLTISPRRGEKYIDENEDFIKNIELCMRGVDEALVAYKCGSAHYFKANFDIDPDSPVYEEYTDAEFEKMAANTFEKNKKEVIEAFLARKK